MARYGFMEGDKQDMAALLKLVKAQGDVFTHDVLHEILLRYGRAIAKQDEDLNSMAERILRLEGELKKAKVTRRQARASMLQNGKRRAQSKK